MKKFLMKFSFFILIGAILIILFNSIYEKTNGYRNMYDTDRFTNVPTNLRLVNVGSSHGMHAFEYDKEMQCFNFALSSQDFYYDYQILMQYKNNLAKNCIVIIPISYFSFGIGYETLKKENIDLRYYRFLNYNLIRSNTLTDLLKFKLLPILSAHEDIRYIIKDKPNLINQWQLETENIYNDSEIKDVGKKRADYHKEITKAENYEYNISMLKNIIKFCITNNYKPVLITTPFTKYYNDNFSDEFFNDFYSKISEISFEYGVPYMDYSHDIRFENELGLFQDTDHLNLIGRNKFTKTVLNDLKFS